ncbi:hypothetical protein BWK57_13990 [Flavobacterium columnare]|uniref:hypothetical protein n=1 Tax=Flavobacterium columnare TaxID=996 RepID=UPI000CDB0F69|nr:hypothetical protein [Flavobacterium columnare]POR18008.1 hypothetical protein BWK57_13990 [Flavobacterium columnare]
MNKETFNKVNAYDELIRVSTVEGEVTPSKAVKAIQNATDYLQHIYDAAFAKGFEAGCEANEKIKNI